MTRTRSDNYEATVPDEPVQIILVKPFSERVMDKIEKVFRKPESAFTLGYLDGICRKGKFNGAHVGRIMNKYKQNVMDSLKGYALRFSIFMYNVIMNNDQYLEIEDLAEIYNIWHELENKQFLGNTELPRLRKKLKVEIDRQARMFRKKGLRCHIKLAKDSDVSY